MKTFPVRPDEAARLHDWLLDRIAAYLERSPSAIDPAVPLAEYGMDSVSALSLCGDLEDELRLFVDPTLVWDYPTVNALVAHLTTLLPAATEGVR
ncbi:acyl carrier protein [Streptomyces sp. E11-3]|uniref:acyl carrier protein n=1 Tax=Streptomyces sp. E11-3 TaxID=3110112 RepID=UPI00397FF943